MLPAAKGTFGVHGSELLRGDLREFGAPDAVVELRNDRETAEQLTARAAELGVQTTSIRSDTLDHGAVVPLWFLARAGWDGPTCVAALPWHATGRLLQLFGDAVGRALRGLSGASAVVASGDMTHRALPDSAAGYDPRAVDFDRRLADLVADGRLDQISEIDPELRRVAAEDAADTCIVVAAANEFRTHGNQVLSYEHPCGVGYLVAVFHDGATV